MNQPSFLRTLAALALLGPGLAGSGCSSSHSESVARLKELAGSCFVNSDCAAPLVCAFQRCHAQCVTSRDCHGVERCVGAHEVSPVCQLAQEASCQTAADCGFGLACGPDGACRDRCTASNECLAEQQCVGGLCAGAAELGDSGALPQLVSYSSCRLNSDCPAGSKCAYQTCVPECRQDGDCEDGKVCASGACHAPVVDGCETTKDCEKPGAECLAGQCHCACLADVDCAAGESCDGCACQAPPPPECTASKQCAAGKVCLAGSCACACVNDRDCAAPLSCDGCSCALTSTIVDAQVDNASDIYRLRGITEVETRLTLGSTLDSTAGLEKIRTVGSLTVSVGTQLGTPPPVGWDPLTGLSGLQLIRGDLNFANSRLTMLSLKDTVVIGGNVTFQNNYFLTACAILDFQARLVAHGFKGDFKRLGGEAYCAWPCQGALCIPPQP